MKLAEFLAIQLDGSREWTLKLIADIKDDDWAFQPAAGLAHPLWLCGHLACSESLLIQQRCLGRKGLLEPSFCNHFSVGGPVKPAREHGYPPVADILDAMSSVHEKTLQSIREMSDSLLAEPAYAADGKSLHPHYRDKGGVVAHCARHEAFHAGQIALIRRLLGKTFLR